MLRNAFRSFLKLRNKSHFPIFPSMRDYHKVRCSPSIRIKGAICGLPTYDGVNKYDGYAFTVYQHNEDDPNSIANDISRIVKTDSQGRVWIGTRDGLSRYDEEKDIFQNFFYEKNGKHLQVNGIEEISPEQLLIRYSGRADHVRYQRIQIYR